MNNNSNLNSPNSNADSRQQIPLKAYFLNKYEQLKNPPALNTAAPSTSSSLSVLLGVNSQQQQAQTISASNLQLSPISSTIALFQQQQQQQQQIELDNQQQQQQQNSKSSKAKMSSAKRHFSGSNSSLQNSDDDDDFLDNSGNMPYSSQSDSVNRSREEKRRLSHTAAEQKRRNAIKRGYDELQSIVPSCDYMDPSSSQKVCKATVLKRSIDYIHELEKEKDTHDHDLDSLKKEIMALKIMKSNYEDILQYHRNMPKNNSVEINDETKFDLFVKFSDNLFQSFQSMINPNSFSELSGSMFNWLEQMCSANNLKNLVLLSLFQAVQQMLH